MFTDIKVKIIKMIKEMMKSRFVELKEDIKQTDALPDRLKHQLQQLRLLHAQI